MKFPIRVKLLLAICVPLSAIYLTLLVIDYYTSKQTAIRAVERYMTQLTSHLADEIDRDLSTVGEAARSCALMMSHYPPPDVTMIETMLRSHLEDNRLIFGAGIAFEPGTFRPGVERFAPYVCRDKSEQQLRTMQITYDYPRWDWYLLPRLEEKPQWTDPYFDEGVGDELMCTYGAPFFQNKTFRGVVGVDVSLKDLRDRLHEADLPGGYCMIVSQSGTFVAHPDNTKVMAESIFSEAEWHESVELDQVGREMIARKTGVRRFFSPLSKQMVWVVYAPIESVGWSMVAVVPERHVLASMYAHLNRQAMLLLSGLGIILALILVVSNWITRPIQTLALAASELARGNLDVQVSGVHSRDEIGQFATTFNQMIRDLKVTVEHRVHETAMREAIERELQVARQIQTSLLPMARPPFPNRKEFSLDANNEPAKIMAGDFFDFWFVDDDTLALVVADVSGKGVPAAMFMAVTRTILRSFSIKGQSPAQVLATANRIIAAENTEERFITIFFAHYYVATGQLIYANAGHNPPFLVHGDGTTEAVGDSTGPLLGVWEEAPYEDATAKLDPGELLLVYTDGATEGTNPEGQMIGETKLQALASKACQQPFDVICRTLLDDVKRHCGGTPQDDVTLLALKREI